jgi:protein-tyrosine-phosphatase
MPFVLFVCSANRFRSPLAEAAFKKCLEEDGSRADWEVSSAGLWTESGLPPVPTALTAAEGMGLNISNHRTQPITTELLSRSDLIIVMQASQREALQVEFPETAGKIILLSETADGIAYDIPDPFDAVDSHQDLAKEVCSLVKRGYNRIAYIVRNREGIS